MSSIYVFIDLSILDCMFLSLVFSYILCHCFIDRKGAKMLIPLSLTLGCIEQVCTNSILGCVLFNREV